MKVHIIDNNLVTNTIEIASVSAAQALFPVSTCIAATIGSVGWSWNGSVLSAPPVAPVAVPEAVTMRQARIALAQAGKLATVNSVIAAMPGAQGDIARIEWEFSNEVKRNQPLVLALIPVLGMTSGEIDQFFITAARL